MSLPLAPDRSTAGIVVDPQTLERVVPSSKRLDGSVRKEIKVRPGFTPVEDISRYRPRAAAAAALPTVPGSAGRSPASGSSRNSHSRYQADLSSETITSSPSSSGSRAQSGNLQPREPRRTGGHDVNRSWDDDASVERVNIDDAIEGMGKLGLGAKQPEEPLGTGSKAPGGGAPTESVSATVASAPSDVQPDLTPPPLTDPPTSSSPTDPTIPPPSAADAPVGASGLVSAEKTEGEWKAARPPSASSTSSGTTSGSRADRDARWVRGEVPPPYDPRRGEFNSGYGSAMRASPPADRGSAARAFPSSQGNLRSAGNRRGLEPLGTRTPASGGGAPRESISATIASSSSNPTPDTAPPLTDPPTSSSHYDPASSPPTAADIPEGASALVSSEKTEREWKAARPPSSSHSESRADRDQKWARGETPPPPSTSRERGFSSGYGSGMKSSPPAERRSEASAMPPFQQTSSFAGREKLAELLGTGSTASGGGAPAESISATIASSSSPTPNSAPSPPLMDPPTSSSHYDPAGRPPAAADMPEGASALVSPEKTERDWKAARPPTSFNSESRADRDQRWVRGETPPPPSNSHRGGASYGYGSGMRGSPAAGWNSPPSRGSSGPGGSYASDRSSGTGMRSSPMSGPGTRNSHPNESPSSAAASWNSPPSRGSGMRSSPSVGLYSTPKDSPSSNRSSGRGETPPSERVRKEIRIRGGAPGSAGSLASRVQGLLADTGRPRGAGRGTAEGESKTPA